LSQTVLLVDDEPDILQLLEIALARMNLNTLSAATVSEAIKLIDTSDLDLCLTDMRLPDGNGLQLVEYAEQLNRELPVAVITAHGSVEAAIDALKLGAFDFVSKPVALDKLRELVGHALNLKRADIETSTRELIGTSPATQRLRGRIRKVARSQAPIHIHGESGAGKEIVARLVHATSSRHAGPFIAVNCGAIPPELVESELFGHLKGSFTGAMYDKQGLFQAANGGTLLLDEVADLPLATQVKLLRVLQEKAVRPVGSESEISIDVRLMSATHKQLSREVAAGTFRDDLFYRINVIDIAVPALKDRREDIPALAHYLLDKVAAENDAGEKALSDAAVQCLTDANYPGNVRQLENILARAAAMSELTTIEADDLEIDRSASLIPSSNDLVTPESETTDTDFRALTGLVAVDGNLEQYMDKIEREILQNAMT
jgi:two-component system response regulator PilR (NtrC family)